MSFHSIRFKKIETEGVSSEELITTMNSFRCEEGKEDMAGRYINDKTYTVKRKHLIIIGAIVLIVVMTLFVISVIVGHYSAKRENDYMTWSGWSVWDKCSVSCGIGIKQRSRTCQSDVEDACMGKNIDTNICVTELCNDDKWSAWSTWSSCTNITGNCKRSRSRSCLNTTLNIEEGRCPGNGSQEAICNTQECGSSWTTWSDWSECSSICDFGVKTRHRSCKDQKGNDVNNTNCSGQSTQKQWCHDIACKGKKTQSILFKARSVQNQSPLVGSTVVFQNVIMNAGDGYDNGTGIFTAPASGTYLFTAQFCLHHRRELSYTIVVNEMAITAASHVDYDWNHICSSSDGMAELKRGDQVKVLVTFTYPKNLEPNLTLIFSDNDNRWWSYFSGVLIHA